MLFKIRKNHWIIILIVSFAYLLPMFITGGVTYYSQQDAHFHMARIVGLSNVFDSPVNYLTFNKTGVLVNEFYPWLTVLPMSVLYQLTDNFIFSYWMYYFGLTILTMVICYKSFQSVKPEWAQSNAPLVFATLYTLSSYRTADILTRAAVGEAITLTFLPILFAGVYHVISGNYKKWYWISIAMALIAYSHMVTLILVVTVMGVMLLTSFYYWQDRYIRLWSLIKATLLTIGLTLFITVPFIEQRMFQPIHIPESRALYGQSIPAYVGKTAINLLHGTVLGPLLILGLVIVIWKWRSLTKEQCYLLVLTVTLIIGMTSLVPWGEISKTTLGGALTQIQFLWRYNGIITLFLAYLITIVTYKINWPQRWTFKQKYTVAVIGMLSVQLGGMAVDYYIDNPVKLTNKQIEKKATNLDEHRDYWPKSVINKRDDVNNHIVDVSDENVEVESRATASKYYVIVRNKTDDSQSIELPVFSYKGQEIRLNNHLVDKNSDKREGITKVVVPAGNSKIEITTKYTPIAKASAGATVIAWLILVVQLCLLHSKKRRENTRI